MRSAKRTTLQKDQKEKILPIPPIPIVQRSYQTLNINSNHAFQFKGKYVKTTSALPSTTLIQQIST